MALSILQFTDPIVGASGIFQRVHLRPTTVNMLAATLGTKVSLNTETVQHLKHMGVLQLFIKTLMNGA